MRDEPMAETDETGVLGSVLRLEIYLNLDSPGALTASTTTFLLMLDIREEGRVSGRKKCARWQDVSRKLPSFCSITDASLSISSPTASPATESA